MSGAKHWEAEAERWAAWARAPGHDSYWTESREPFLALLPAAGKRTLDLGCGEGRVARDLTAAGHTVAGIDVSPTMVRLAQEADSDGNYVVADAAHLPFENAAFDLVVAFARRNRPTSVRRQTQRSAARAAKRSSGRPHECAPRAAKPRATRTPGGNRPPP